MSITKLTYSKAIYSAFDYLLENFPEVFVIGQGLWSPWYVGNTMNKLEEKYGKERIIDTPVSEAACTGAAVGASLCGMKPIMVHPRMDFMMYAMDPIVNQAAKWSYMFGGQSHPSITIRAIINRGGEQGAQHSQALHSWYSHIPGLRVVMPSNVKDARDLLIASVICKDPVIYIDDKWLYNLEEDLQPIKHTELKYEEPNIIQEGNYLTLVASGFSTFLAKKSISILKERYKLSGIELIDLRILNPLNPKVIIDSVKKTKRILVVDGGWKSCGLASEVITSVMEEIDPILLKSSPKRICLPDSPAPTSRILEKEYYLSEVTLAEQIKMMFI
tara:strand:- start:98 stop:1090 length:993 start_codon:yes stop_codon:yes gene_type:complete